MLLLTACNQYKKLVRFYLPLPISATVYIFTGSAFIFLTLTSSFPSFSLPFHYIPSAVPSIPLDIQHFLQPVTVASGEMGCHAYVINID